MRMAKREELETIVDLKLAMFKEAGVETGLIDKAPAKILTYYQKLYDQEKMRHFVALADNQLAACAGGFIKDDLPHCFFKPTYYGFIGDVYTVPDYRRQGWATKLTKQVIDWLTKQDVEEIRLLTSEAGRDIYEKLGFVASDELVLKL